jgi:hypothetical protein
MPLWPCGEKEADRDGAAPTRSHADPGKSLRRFQLASHDLDIRGAGNLLGDEQSGNIRQVGI